MLLRDIITEWVCGGCYSDPCQCEVNESGARSVFGHGSKKKKGAVRKYRCTHGPRKGRVVAKAATCNAPINVKASNTLKKTRRSKGKTTDIKRARTGRVSGTTKRLGRINTGYRTVKPRKRRGAKGRR